MICDVCKQMLENQKKSYWKGTYDLSFEHHGDELSLRESAEKHCCICTAIWWKVGKLEKGENIPNSPGLATWEQRCFTRASLSYVHQWKVYRLDFRLSPLYNSERAGSFFLKPKGFEKQAHRHRHEITNSTSTYEVFRLAKNWLDECVTSHRMCRHWIEGRYVTLSHCWGLTPFLHLNNATLSRFEEGVELEALPKTFRHAFDFACRLGVRYIWIDSLCILQDSQEDWLYQSAQMDQVYNNSLCNLSATAAGNSTVGLYSKRDETQSWTDDVDLKTDGIPGRDDLTSKQTCTILDLTFWQRIIDEAPVNKRGWVLQERLIAPRVLHFCHDQIAWECWEKDFAESRPDNLPLHQLTGGSVIDGNRLKGMIPSLNGKMLREARLGKNKHGEQITIDEHLVHAIPSIYCFELWKRVVEVYSKCLLTKSYDKLIALAGIAKIMSRRILNGKDENYIAGMWRTYLESQLLWRVDPVVEKGKFLLHSARPEEYRAPSWTWAAVDTPYGVRYGDATDYGQDPKKKEKSLFIHVDKVKLERRTRDHFGIVTGGYVVLKGVLKKIVIVDSQRESYTRYHWQLKKDGKLLDETYKMIYLDAPKSDCPGVVDRQDGKKFVDGRMYCLPAARDRSNLELEESPQELICLLLQAIEGEPGTFRRIGLTKISRYHPKSQEEVLGLSTSEDEAKMPCPWDAVAKKHTIRVI
ncbi:heterokaryon incompatibility protein-domain-containing protein [Halenospora varia]|nr:heterokaryon incompatibility protein-domain-containing protein [Halenospora varia]